MDRPLPRGRHTLSREAVARTQRERMLRAMAEAMLEQGYVRTSVADVLRRAGVSRATFYEQFRSKEDCFMSAYEAAVGLLLARVSPSPQPRATPLERFDRALGAYLDALASEPGFARLFLVEVFAAGPEAIARRAHAQQRFAEAIGRLLGARSEHDRFAVEALVAAVGSLVTARLAAGDIDGLRALRAPLVELVRTHLDAGRSGTPMSCKAPTMES